MSAYESHVIETGAPAAEKRRVLSLRARKKILFVTNTSEYGGAERHTLDLIRRIRRLNLKVSILCLEKDFFSLRLGSDHDVDIITCKKAPRSLWDWVRLFRAFQPDIVVFVFHWFWAIPCVAIVGAWLAGVRRRFSIQHLMTPAVPVTAPLLAAMKKRRSVRGVLRKLLRRPEPRWLADVRLCVIASMSSPAQLRRSAYLSSTTICVSNSIRDSLIKDFGFPGKKVKTIHNGVSVSEFVPSESRESEVRRKLGIGPDEFVLVCAARLSEVKGIDILLQALAQVLRAGVCCKCIIVGDGPLKSELFEQARSLGLSGHVFFEGFHEDVRPYLQTGSAFILTSHREGLPLSILEAMACSLPIIATNVGGNAEAVTDRIHGLLVPPGSVELVAEAITFLAKHAEECAQMSRSARSRVCEAFNIDVQMAEIERVILG